MSRDNFLNDCRAKCRGHSNLKGAFYIGCYNDNFNAKTKSRDLPIYIGEDMTI